MWRQETQDHSIRVRRTRCMWSCLIASDDRKSPASCGRMLAVLLKSSDWWNLLGHVYRNVHVKSQVNGQTQVILELKEEKWVQFSSCSGVHGLYLQGGQFFFFFFLSFMGWEGFLRGKVEAFSIPGKTWSQKKLTGCLVWVREQSLYLALHECIHGIDRVNDWGNDGKKSLFLSDVWWQGSCKGRLVTKEQVDSSGTWVPAQTLHLWRHPCSGDGHSLIFTDYIEVLKPTFLYLNKVLVLHLSEKGCKLLLIPWTGTKALLLFSLKNSCWLCGLLPPLDPCYWNFKKCHVFDSLPSGCVLFWFILKWWWNVGLLQKIQLPTVSLRPFSVGNMPPVSCGISKIL